MNRANPLPFLYNSGSGAEDGVEARASAEWARTQ